MNLAVAQRAGRTHLKVSRPMSDTSLMTTMTPTNDTVSSSSLNVAVAITAVYVLAYWKMKALWSR